MDSTDLKQKATLIRKWCLVSTTTAGSGHPTSCLSAADLTTVLFDKYFSYDIQNPLNKYNDRLILSKGHAAPLFYTLFAMSGAIPMEDLKTLRKFGSQLEGHPTLRFPYTDAATGSLGQGLSVGCGLAYLAKQENLGFKTYVMLGDGELAEGQVWEAANFASIHKLNNLIVIADINRLAQSQETMFGWQTEEYEKRFNAFGFETIVIDGHNFDEINRTFEWTLQKDFYISFLMGTKNISSSDLEKLGITIIETKGNIYKIEIPQGNIEQYFKLLEEKLENGYWNEVLGPDIQMLFKYKDGKIKKFVLTPQTANEIYPMMYEFNNQPIPESKNQYQDILHEWASGQGADAFYTDYFKPKAIIAKTVKGKGVSFLENKDGWHGKTLKKEELEKALVELGEVDENLRFALHNPQTVILEGSSSTDERPIESHTDTIAFPQGDYVFHTVALQDDRALGYKLGELISTREVYGKELAMLGDQNQNIWALDGDVKNSTFSIDFLKAHPKRFIECFIAEQNMVGVALGLQRLGKIPFVSTFASFLTRAADQIRMSRISDANIKFVGSHAGVSIGEDGPSQMGLEDIALFAAIPDSIIFQPADGVSTAKVLPLMASHLGISYLRTLRPKTPVIYDQSEEFTIGGAKVLRSSENDLLTVAASGITVHEALKAYEVLQKENISIRVIDCYSVKPVDKKTLENALQQTKKKIIITVEDHFEHGGLGDLILSAMSETGAQIEKMAVTKISQSGKMDELLDDAGISSKQIVEKVKAAVA